MCMKSISCKATEDEACPLAQNTGAKSNSKNINKRLPEIEERTVREPLELLHMDLFGPVSVESINKKKYCLVVTDDCSKFSWVFFLAYKDETYDMLHDLIVGLENRLRHKVKTIRTPQQNGVAERKNRTLIEAAMKLYWSFPSTNSFDAEEGGVADYNNLDPTIDVPSTPTLRIHKIHPQSQIIGKSTAGRNPRKVSQALAKKVGLKQCKMNCIIQELQERDERGTIIKNKARLVAQGYRQEEGVDYDECIFVCNITEEVYVKRSQGIEDPAHPNKVYKFVKALYGLPSAQDPWSMIGCLMYLTGFKTRLMFAVLSVKKL
ncbi:putative ribonuclease H-like domain-containing protein [Tanacetum coccineum]